ncbi:MAG TPA: hypothetical protein VK179_16190 [Bacteroidales bacterium]|nr:hypothetical protein [Bacteroidales bacterium]
MLPKTISIRPFIGAKDFNTSRSFYRDLGFDETRLSEKMSVYKASQLAFYLQDAYEKDWIDNTMIFMEVEDVNAFWFYLKSLELENTYKDVRLTPVKSFDWGSECYLHDPSGILWHFGSFAL